MRRAFAGAAGLAMVGGLMACGGGGESEPQSVDAGKTLEITSQLETEMTSLSGNDLGTLDAGSTIIALCVEPGNQVNNDQIQAVVDPVTPYWVEAQTTAYEEVFDVSGAELLEELGRCE